MVQLGAALQGACSLTELSLSCFKQHATHAAVMDALKQLPALRSFSLFLNPVPRAHHAAVGAALGALLATNLPGLRILRAAEQLGDEGLAPLLDGLAANTHLRELKCGPHDASLAFARDRLEPAMAALAARAPAAP